MKDKWEKEFDEIGFGNQARIVGAKRVELKDFIRSLLASQRRELMEKVEGVVINKFKLGSAHGEMNRAEKQIKYFVNLVLDDVLNLLKEKKGDK